MKEYAITDVWVSEELAYMLVCNHNCSMPRYDPETVNIATVAYLWNIPTDYIRVYRNVITDPEDSLAKELLLINTTEARLEYLNS